MTIEIYEESACTCANVKSKQTHSPKWVCHKTLVMTTLLQWPIQQNQYCTVVSVTIITSIQNVEKRTKLYINTMEYMFQWKVISHHCTEEQVENGDASKCVCCFIYCVCKTDRITVKQIILFRKPLRLMEVLRVRWRARIIAWLSWTVVQIQSTITYTHLSHMRCDGGSTDPPKQKDEVGVWWNCHP